MLWKLSDQLSSNQQELKIIEEAMGDNQYLHILETIEWKIPVDLYEMGITSATKSKLDILKKMIMTLAQNERGVNSQGASDFLRVDALFVDDLIRQMERTGLLENDADVYRLTKVGQAQLAAGTVLSEPKVEHFKFYVNALQNIVLNEVETNPFVYSEIESDEETQLYRHRDDEVDLRNKILKEAEFKQYLLDSGQPFEIGGKEKIISKIEPLELIDRRYGKVIEFRLYDLAKDEVFTRVWNGALSKFDESLENQINEIENETWREKYHEEILDQVPNRYEHLRKLMLQDEEKEKNGKEKMIELLRGIDIRERFLDSFEQTQRKMLMVSPWISTSVMDREMFNRLEKFASEGKTLFISWGIAKHLRNEDRAPDAELIQKIRSIRHKDGTPAVFIRWFGNQHNKEIVIDRETLLLGSFNWLSYRGDYNLRHESVMVTSEDNLIQETSYMIEEKFINELERELQVILNHPPQDLVALVLKRWMKELIMLDSQLEKRKELAERLIQHLRNENKHDLILVLAKLWLIYDKEEMGAHDYLKELLVAHETDVATEYFMLALKYVSTSSLWPTAEIFSSHVDWFGQFRKFIEAKEELVKENKYRVIKSNKKSKKRKKR
ncbi:hypothetical protein [Exiguobacterium sp. s154]|uniref:hypothetical protein n=1 Tax=Exiguobacterium sp. s154 TaxID=2751277 RepID=UPI001BEC999A|nr:hypothetical protein [Exiguobacterium sp. s154]